MDSYRLAREMNTPGFPERTNDNSFELELNNGSRVIALPGSEESILGFTPNLIVLDEAAVMSDKFYQSVRPMLAVSHGTLILASSPRGKRGFFWENWKKKDDADSAWKFFKATADDCPRIEKKFLEDELAALGQDWYEQEYYCRFLETAGGLFTDDMISAIFTDDGYVIDPGAFDVNLTEENSYGWQGMFDAATA
jgi:putative intracellular protease/amidase